MRLPRERRSVSSLAASPCLHPRIAARREMGSEPLRSPAKSAHLPLVRLMDRLEPGSPLMEPTRNSWPSFLPAGNHSQQRDSSEPSAAELTAAKSRRGVIRCGMAQGVPLAGVRQPEKKDPPRETMPGAEGRGVYCVQRASLGSVRKQEPDVIHRPSHDGDASGLLDGGLPCLLLRAEST